MDMNIIMNDSHIVSMWQVEESVKTAVVPTFSFDSHQQAHAWVSEVLDRFRYFDKQRTKKEKVLIRAYITHPCVCLLVGIERECWNNCSFYTLLDLPHAHYVRIVHDDVHIHQSCIICPSERKWAFEAHLLGKRRLFDAHYEWEETPPAIGHK